MNINLHIERLILDGVDTAPAQRDLLQTKVATELTRMLNDGGLAHNLAEGVALPRISASDIQFTGNKPMELGHKIAKSVYGGIGHE